MKWYARGGGIAQMGPFKTQIEAVNALQLIRPNVDGRNRLFPVDAFVWPETRRKEGRR